MATVLIKYKTEEKYTYEQVVKMMEDSANNTFKGLPHLHSKQFCFDIETGEGLSIYLWDSKEIAQAYFTPEWEVYFEKKFGCTAHITYYDTILTLDNRMNDIIYG
ncbi:MAG: hypothetical protein HOH19_04350 [Kordiimonadaceae bacterium]|jgi:hypothetical protein|nr:hypothetical protein [Kordiimonadaceae bacterium]MBT6031783.1 hypothetical protein [Kordiimonadaceae bacterium]